MLLEYCNVQANIYYCGSTKSYYGEVLNIEAVIVVQASSKQDAIAAVYIAIQQWLAHFQ